MDQPCAPLLTPKLCIQAFYWKNSVFGTCWLCLAMATLSPVPDVIGSFWPSRDFGATAEVLYGTDVVFYFHLSNQEIVAPN